MTNNKYDEFWHGAKPYEYEYLDLTDESEAYAYIQAAIETMDKEIILEACSHIIMGREIVMLKTNTKSR